MTVLHFRGCPPDETGVSAPDDSRQVGEQGQSHGKEDRMRNYELAYIANPDLDEEALSALEERIQGWIEAQEGTIQEVDRWGRRKLAYPIQDYRDGYYYFLTVELPSPGPAALERDMVVNEDILRFMITRKEPA
jgi:small subunit ribosomal protein S6